MHFYRYRPYSELSIKELLYSEIYFASPEECNDPFDSKAFSIFCGDKLKWQKTIELVCKQNDILIQKPIMEQMADYIAAKCPISFDEAVNEDLLDGFEYPSEGTMVSATLMTEVLNKMIQRLLNIYKPDLRYFVSFSKIATEPLMWSHYSDKHKGFCLIFKAIDGVLLLSPNYRRNAIHRITSNGIAENMTFSLPEKFKFKDIEYKSNVKPFDAFKNMPQYVVGEVSEKKRNLILTERERHYAQKDISWAYEKESRLIISPPPSWLFGEHVGYTKTERLFNYEPSQLVGIIYGARMSSVDIERIREVLKLRKEWMHRHIYKKITFNFIEFQAQLSTNQRKVEIEPLNIICAKDIPKSDKDFDRLHKEWIAGIGFEQSENRSTKVRVK